MLDGEQKAHTSVDHRSVVNLSSNNYLGLTTHPLLRERAARGDSSASASARARCAPSPARWPSTWSSNAGSPTFKHTEAAVVFQSGFTANAGTVSSILGKDDFIVSDELNHASIIDGARLSRATIKVFPHRDAAAARADRRGAAARPADA